MLAFSIASHTLQPPIGGVRGSEASGQGDQVVGRGVGLEVGGVELDRQELDQAVDDHLVVASLVVGVDQLLDLECLSDLADLAVLAALRPGGLGRGVGAVRVIHHALILPPSPLLVKEEARRGKVSQWAS